MLYLCFYFLESCSLQSTHLNLTFLKRPQSRNASCLFTPASSSLFPAPHHSGLPNYLVYVQLFGSLAPLSPNVAIIPAVQAKCTVLRHIPRLG